MAVEASDYCCVVYSVSVLRESASVPLSAVEVLSAPPSTTTSVKF